VKVLYDHHVFQLQRYGGVSRYFYELISHLIRLGDVEASLFLGFYINGYGVERLPGLARVTGMPRPPIRALERVFPRLADMWLQRAYDLRRFDLFHQTYYTAQDPVRGRCPSVLTVHDMIHELHPQSERQKEWMVSMKRPSVDRSDAVIAISESTKRDLMRLYGTPEEKIHVIHHANSLQVEAAPTSLLARPYVLFVGTRTGYKNFALLARAYAQRPDVVRDFDLVCFGGGAFTPEERALLAELGLGERVHHFAGADEVLATLYRHAAVMAYPSRYEGFGLPALEAMHYGCPVIVADTSSLPEVVGDAAERVEPDSQESLAEALARVLQDAERKAELVRRGYEQERRFSWERCATETLALYRQVAAR